MERHRVIRAERYCKNLCDGLDETSMRILEVANSDVTNSYAKD